MTLRFPEGRIVQFVLSYDANTIDSYGAVGTEGSVQMSPGYMYGKPLEQAITIGESQSGKSFKNTDHFGGALRYFSDCILNGTDPEPDGEEGYADVQVLEGIIRAMEAGMPQTLSPVSRSKRIDIGQVQKLSARGSPELMNTSYPGKY